MNQRLKSGSKGTSLALYIVRTAAEREVFYTYVYNKLKILSFKCACPASVNQTEASIFQSLKLSLDQHTNPSNNEAFPYHNISSACLNRL